MAQFAQCSRLKKDQSCTDSGERNDLGLQDLENAILGHGAEALQLSSLVKCPDRHAFARDLVSRALNFPETNPAGRREERA